ncbi:helix-turn-helix domain-containing protein [Microbacterium indicum]|uniref:helix-turn-helix domain-containing protein n=1 Tax=Microbacterium indicum TaxID=358100 RepID=UPI00041A294B|nr:helix-turn-helix transcriptional regulator [Microbacterium indicum]
MSSSSQNLFGRDLELERARSRFASALEFRAQAITIEGPPGIGKSALARNLAWELMADPQWRVIVVPCLDGDRAKPGIVAERIVSAIDAPVSAGDPLSRLIEAFNSEAIATCLVLEDLQWIDDETSEAIWRVAENYQSARALFIATARTGSSPLFERVKRFSATGFHGAHLSLGPLDEDAVRALASARLGVPAPRGLAGRLHDATGGSPLHVDIALDHLVSAAPGRRSLDAALEALDDGTSQRSRRFEAATADALAAESPSVRAALELLGFADRALPFTFIDDELEAEGLALVDAWELRATGLVAFAGDARVRPVHRAASSAIRLATARSRRSALHQALATVGTRKQRLPHRLAILGRSPSPETSAALVDDLMQVGASDAHDGHFSAAFGWFGAAAAITTSPEPVVAAIRAAVAADRLALLARLDADAVASAEPAIRVAISALLAIEDRSLTRAFALIDGVVGAPSSAGGALVLAAAASLAARSAFWLGDIEVGKRASAALADALDRMAEAPGDAGAQGAAGTGELLGLAGVLRYWSAFGAARGSAASAAPPEMTSLADRIAEYPSAGFIQQGVRTIAGAVLQRRGSMREGYEQLSLAAAAPAEPRLRAHAQTELALVRFAAGELGEAERAATLALSNTLMDSDGPDALFTYAVAALVSAVKGDTEAAAAHLDRIDAAPTRFSAAPVVGATASLARGWWAFRDGDHDETVRHLRAIDENRIGWWIVGLPATMLLARSLAATGRHDALPALVRRIEDPARRYDERACAALVRYARAWVSAGDGDGAAAAAHLLAAVDGFDALEPICAPEGGAAGGGLRLYRSIAALDAAARLRAEAGDASSPAVLRARELAVEAAQEFERAGLGRLAAEARDVASTGGAAASPASGARGGAATPVSLPPAIVELLTRRELQIASLVNDGFSNREIADELFISVRTVEFHVHNVLRKLDVGSRSALRRLMRETDCPT